MGARAVASKRIEPGSRVHSAVGHNTGHKKGTVSFVVKDMISGIRTYEITWDGESRRLYRYGAHEIELILPLNKQVS